MSFWKKIFGKSEPDPTPGAPSTGDDHAVLLHIALVDSWPSDEERQRYFALQEELEAAITEEGAGELDGDEWGEGQCTIYMYGPDAERLWTAIAPVLERHPFPKGSHAIKRLGGPGAEQERVKFGWDG